MDPKTTLSGNRNSSIQTGKPTFPSPHGIWYSAYLLSILCLELVGDGLDWRPSISMQLIYWHYACMGAREMAASFYAFSSFTLFSQTYHRHKALLHKSSKKPWMSNLRRPLSCSAIPPLSFLMGCVYANCSVLLSVLCHDNYL